MGKKPDFAAKLDDQSAESNSDFRKVYGKPKLPAGLQQQAITRTVNALSILNFESSAAGMVIPAGTSDGQLEQLEDTLFALEDGMQLYIGDYLVAVDNREYGETKAIADRRHRDPATLYKWKSICNAVTVFLRRKVLAAYPAAKPLTLTHYEIVMALSEDDQERWLNAAAAGGWKTRQLSAEIAKAQLPASADGNTTMVSPDVEPEDPDPPAPLPVYVHSLPAAVKDKSHRERMNHIWKKVEHDEPMTDEDMGDVWLIKKWCDMVIEGKRKKK